MILVLNNNSYSSNNNHHHHHPGSFTRILDGYNAFQCLGGTGSRPELWLRPFQTHDSQTKYQHRMLNTSLFGILLTHHGKTHKKTCHVCLKCCEYGSYALFLIGWQLQIYQYLWMDSKKCTNQLLSWNLPIFPHLCMFVCPSPKQYQNNN